MQSLDLTQHGVVTVYVESGDSCIAKLLLGLAPWDKSLCIHLITKPTYRYTSVCVSPGKPNYTQVEIQIHENRLRFRGYYSIEIPGCDFRSGGAGEWVDVAFKDYQRALDLTKEWFQVYG